MNSWIDDVGGYTNATFRTENPLPPGIYTLQAEWIKSQEVEGRRSEATLAQGNISNIVVVAGQETTNVFIPVKMVVQTNGASGR